MLGVLNIIRNAMFFYEHDTAHNEDLDQVFQIRYDFEHVVFPLAHRKDAKGHVRGAKKRLSLTY